VIVSSATASGSYDHGKAWRQSPLLSLADDGDRDLERHRRESKKLVSRVRPVRLRRPALNFGATMRLRAASRGA
jgi:hypothetical protein